MTSTNTSDDELVRRAFAAWYRAGNTDQPSNASDVYEVDGKRYVVLCNVTGTMAVFRVTNAGPLKRLKRWPTALDI